MVKATRSRRLDTRLVHVPVFLGAGWCVVSVWPSVTASFTPWATKLFQLGGSLYTVGLVPWISNSFEGHNAAWHAFVLVASACFFAVCYEEIAIAGVGGVGGVGGAGGRA